jgi:hypothetical protein
MSRRLLTAARVCAAAVVAFALAAPAVAGNPGRGYRCEWVVVCGPGKSPCKRTRVCKSKIDPRGDQSSPDADAADRGWHALGQGEATDPATGGRP